MLFFTKILGGDNIMIDNCSKRIHKDNYFLELSQGAINLYEETNDQIVKCKNLAYIILNCRKIAISKITERTIVHLFNNKVDFELIYNKDGTIDVSFNDCIKKEQDYKKQLKMQNRALEELERMYSANQHSSSNGRMFGICLSGLCTALGVSGIVLAKVIEKNTPWGSFFLNIAGRMVSLSGERALQYSFASSPTRYDNHECLKQAAQAGCEGLIQGTFAAGGKLLEPLAGQKAATFCSSIMGKTASELALDIYEGKSLTARSLKHTATKAALASGAAIMTRNYLPKSTNIIDNMIDEGLVSSASSLGGIAGKSFGEGKLSLKNAVEETFFSFGMGAFHGGLYAGCMAAFDPFVSKRIELFNARETQKKLFVSENDAHLKGEEKVLHDVIRPQIAKNSAKISDLEFELRHMANNPYAAIKIQREIRVGNDRILRGYAEEHTQHVRGDQRNLEHTREVMQRDSNYVNSKEDQLFRVVRPPQYVMHPESNLDNIEDRELSEADRQCYNFLMRLINDGCTYDNFLSDLNSLNENEKPIFGKAVQVFIFMREISYDNLQESFEILFAVSRFTTIDFELFFQSLPNDLLLDLLASNSNATKIYKSVILNM